MLVTIVVKSVKFMDVHSPSPVTEPLENCSSNTGVLHVSRVGLGDEPMYVATLVIAALVALKENRLSG